MDSQWYKDENLLAISVECDEAFDFSDIEKLEKLVQICWDNGHRADYGDLVRAKYLYNSATCLQNLLQKNIENEMKNREYSTTIIGMKKYEAKYEKILYCFRTAVRLFKSKSKNLPEFTKEEQSYFLGFCFQLTVNYSNLLYENGRIIKSIGLLSTIKNEKFPMGLLNLGFKIIEYGKLNYDTSNQNIMGHVANKYLNLAMQSESSYPEKDLISPQVEKYREELRKKLGKDYLETDYGVKDFVVPMDNMEEDEKQYRLWCANNQLSLSPLNDIFTELEAGYDPLHLPELEGDIKEDVMSPHFHGMLNQIKQEYVSARFLAYEGISKRGLHFSDKEVFLINTLDYPIYGLGIEKVKAAYRSMYAIFDRISYFLNKYFRLNIRERDVSFKSIWFKGNDEQLLEIMNKNYPLLGLWWIFKDISNRTIDGKNKHLDPVIARISEVRNHMEHRYFKVVDILDSNNSTVDSFATSISFSEFEKLTISLMKYTRESILLLVMAVYVEEYRRRIERGENGMVGQISLSKYDDDWKQIF